MPLRVMRALAILAALSAFAFLASAEMLEQISAARPAVLDLLLPDGAAATIDGKDTGGTRTLSIDDVPATGFRRVKVEVQYAGGNQDERLVDVASGQRITVPMPTPGSEKPATVTAGVLTPIQSAALSRDGRFIAVAMETVIVLWDTTVGRPIRTLSGHQKLVTSVAFSPDSKQVLSGSADATAILWDTTTGMQVRTFKGHKGSVRSVAISPDAKRVLTGSADKTAILWTVQTGQPLLTLPGHERDIMAVAYSPDGTRVATASADTSGTIWDTTTGKYTFILSGHREEVDCIAFSPDGRRVATGSYDDSAILWDTQTGRRLGTAARHTNDVYSIAFTPDGSRVITGERQELVQISDAATGKSVRTLPGHTAEIMSVTTSPDGRMFLTGSRDGTARLWDPASGRELLCLTTDPSRKNWAVAAPDGLFDATGAGRHMLGYRFTRTHGGSVDQFFDAYYHPGLLAEFFRGKWPMAQKPLGRSTPPLVKIVSPKGRAPATQDVKLVVDLIDQGGGISGLIIENNAARIAVPTRTEPAPDRRTTRLSCSVSLTPGPNRIRVRSASADGSWESTGAEIELTYPRSPEHKPRMYVVAVGVSNHAEKLLCLDFPAKDAQALAELLQQRCGKLCDRVDVIPLLNGDATKSIIEDTVLDVAELSRPQDTLVVILCGHGMLLGDRLYFAAHDLRIGTDRPEEGLRARGLVVDEVAKAMGTARALKRVLILDTAASGNVFAGAFKRRSEFALRGAVERLSRSHGIFALAATAAKDDAAERAELGHGALSYALLASASRVDAGPLRGKALEPIDPTGTVDVSDWFGFALEQASLVMEKLSAAPLDMHASAPAKGIPILVLDRPH